MDASQTSDQDLKNFGKRLALLLAAADMPADVKEAMAAMIPEMSLEQMDRLSQLLEKQVATVPPSELEDFRAAVGEAQKNYQASMAQANATALDELAKIEKQVK
jgi:hypothetical protein